MGSVSEKEGNRIRKNPRREKDKEDGNEQKRVDGKVKRKRKAEAALQYIL